MSSYRWQGRKRRAFDPSREAASIPDRRAALLQNKVMDSRKESIVIDGRDAETDATAISHDQLARV